MGVENMAWSSKFNYQKYPIASTADVIVPASIFAATDILTIPTTVPNIRTFRVYAEYAGKVEKLSRLSLTGSRASLYARAQANNLIISCDSSDAAPVNIKIHYRVYLDA